MKGDKPTPRERQLLDLLFASEGRPVEISDLAYALAGSRTLRNLQLVRVIASRLRSKFPKMKIEATSGGYVLNARRCPSCGGSGWFVPTADDIAAEIEGKVAHP